MYELVVLMKSWLKEPAFSYLANGCGFRFYNNMNFIILMKNSNVLYHSLTELSEAIGAAEDSNKLY